jgi:hypothetical protein
MAKEIEIASYCESDCNEVAVKGAKKTSTAEKECTNYSIKSKDVKGAKAC